MITIDGITVLSAEAIKDYNQLAEVVIYGGVIVMVVALITWIIRHRHDAYVTKKELLPVVIGVVVGLAISIFGTIRFPWFYSDTGRNRYVCVIDDNASFVDIYNNYDIVEVKGEYYTLADKKE